jgi:hypothetical protein
MRSMKDNPPSSNTDLWCCGCVRSNVAQELLAAAAALTLLRRLKTPASRIWHLNTYRTPILESHCVTDCDAEEAQIAVRAHMEPVLLKGGETLRALSTQQGPRTLR